MKYTTVTNPKYISQCGNYIECIVDFQDLGVTKFVAYRDDVEDHGREIYSRIANGEFGNIAPYVSDIFPIISLANTVRNKRNQLLQAVDQLVLNPFRFAGYSEEYKQQLSSYRQQLLDITDQPGFPNTVDWPTPPEGILDSGRPSTTTD